MLSICRQQFNSHIIIVQMSTFYKDMAAITQTLLPYHGKSPHKKYFIKVWQLSPILFYLMVKACTNNILWQPSPKLFYIIMVKVYQKYFRNAWQLSAKLFYLFMVKVCIKNIHKNILVQTCRLMI